MKIVVVLSGGLDSTTVLYRMRSEYGDVRALTFDYGQSHRVQELRAAKRTCDLLGIPQTIADISAIQHLIDHSSLTGNIPLPLGEYAATTMTSTVVPNRNMIIGAIAIGYAINTDADAVAFGVHSGDHDLYPDCRPEFMRALNAVSEVANYRYVKIFAPYMNLTKADIIRDGMTLGVDYANTWSCYAGGEVPCGKCGTCLERADAFLKVGIPDPLLEVSHDQ